MSPEQTDPEKVETAGQPPLLLAFLRVLHSLIKNATIELPNGVRVVVDHVSPESHSIRFHCAREVSPCDEPCQDVSAFDFGQGETVGICRNLEELLGCSQQLTGESEQMSRDGINKLRKGVLHVLTPEEKARLLGIEDEFFKAFQEANVELNSLQLLQYWFTNRINRLKTNDRKSPKRPIKAQKKVGDYLYTLQPGQKGGDYWYLHFSRNGKRHHVYLGKETPTFEPATDLTQKRKPRARAAGA